MPRTPPLVIRRQHRTADALACLLALARVLCGGAEAGFERVERVLDGVVERVQGQPRVAVSQRRHQLHCL
eukprot:3569719-Rhodomonas_salina.1